MFPPHGSRRPPPNPLSEGFPITVGAVRFGVDRGSAHRSRERGRCVPAGGRRDRRPLGWSHRPRGSRGRSGLGFRSHGSDRIPASGWCGRPGRVFFPRLVPASVLRPAPLRLHLRRLDPRRRRVGKAAAQGRAGSILLRPLRGGLLRGSDPGGTGRRRAPVPDGFGEPPPRSRPRARPGLQGRAIHGVLFAAAGTGLPHPRPPGADLFAPRGRAFDPHSSGLRARGLRRRFVLHGLPRRPARSRVAPLRPRVDRRRRSGRGHGVAGRALTPGHPLRRPHLHGDPGRAPPRHRAAHGFARANLPIGGGGRSVRGGSSLAERALRDPVARGDRSARLEAPGRSPPGPRPAIENARIDSSRHCPPGFGPRPGPLPPRAVGLLRSAPRVRATARVQSRHPARRSSRTLLRSGVRPLRLRADIRPLPRGLRSPVASSSRSRGGRALRRPLRGRHRECLADVARRLQSARALPRAPRLHPRHHARARASAGLPHVHGPARRLESLVRPLRGDEHRDHSSRSGWGGALRPRCRRSSCPRIGPRAYSPFPGRFCSRCR